MLSDFVTHKRELRPLQLAYFEGDLQQHFKILDPFRSTSIWVVVHLHHKPEIEPAVSSLY